MSAASPDLLALSPRVTRIICEAAEIARASGALDSHVADNGIATAANQMPPTRRPVFSLDGAMPVDRTRPPGGPEAAKPGTVLTFQSRRVRFSSDFHPQLSRKNVQKKDS